MNLKSEIAPWLEIRRIPDDPETLRRHVTAEEWESSLSMNPVGRRCEWLAWRAVVRQRLGQQTVISYDTQGAPMVSRGHIGVSHTRGWVAVVWSPEPCSVDIEPASRDVSRTAPRFVSDEERALADSADPRFPVSVWCAKEAAYKLARTPGLDFLKDIRITSSDIANDRMQASIRGGEPLTVELIFRDGLTVATII